MELWFELRTSDGGSGKGEEVDEGAERGGSGTKAPVTPAVDTIIYHCV